MNDIINGMFECLGSVFISFSIFKLFKDKMVRGVSWVHVSFFSVWGFWNLYYYPSLNQWVSFYGGIGVTLANTAYLIMLIYYSCNQQENKQ